jgi:Protein of unknown function (DUF1549)/Protein of unknown function (DUF1553)
MVLLRVGLPIIALLAALAGEPLLAAPPDPAKLAARIDERLDARWKSQRIEPAPRADDAEFLRRAALDLNGRIPPAADVYEFLADDAADKRAKLIDRLLEEPRFAIHFSNLWRAELLPEATTNQQAAELTRGFENWLLQRLRAGVRYDQLVRELLTVPLPKSGEPAEPVLRDPERPNPLAFLAAKDSKPENIAAAVTRTFLGIRLECAQCHDHPFAKWSQQQFWSQAAFFAGLEKHANGLLAPLTEAMDRHEIASPRGGEMVRADFLAGSSPDWRLDRSPRTTYADWLTSPENPFFARAAVNRLWGQLFGLGIVDPVDDFHDNNPPSDPELLDELAAAFVSSGFDLCFMIRSICQSAAYQRTSARTHASQDDTRLPARMVVKALTGEQFFDSFVVATGHRDTGERGNARQQFLARFALAGPISEPETSVQQALTLLNGRVVAQAADPEQSPALVAITQTPHLTTAVKIEAMYLSALSRRPTSIETEKLRSYVVAASPDRENERLADIFWMLLNCVEFRVNH